MNSEELRYLRNDIKLTEKCAAIIKNLKRKEKTKIMKRKELIKRIEELECRCKQLEIKQELRDFKDKLNGKTYLVELDQISFCMAHVFSRMRPLLVRCLSKDGKSVLSYEITIPNDEYAARENDGYLEICQANTKKNTYIQEVIKLDDDELVDVPLEVYKKAYPGRDVIPEELLKKDKQEEKTND